MNEQENTSPKTVSEQPIDLVTTLREVYLNGMRYMEQEDPNLPKTTPEVPVKLTGTDTVNDLLVLVNGLALCTNALLHYTSLPECPENAEQRKNALAAILGAFAAESKFSQVVAIYHHTQMLKEAGVDPEDKDAVLAYLKQAGNNIVVTVPEAKPAGPVVTQ